MAAPTKVYAKTYEVAFTAEQVSALRREAALSGQTVSDVVRQAVAAALLRGRREAEDPS